MRKFFQSNLFILLALGIWGYASGLRLDNYQKHISNIFDKYSFQKEATERTDTSETPELQPKEGDTDESINEVQPLPRNPFEDIDNRARQCPKKAEATVATLANYLGGNAETDLEKSRAIYVWITENISYADDEYNAEKYGDMSAEGVLARKKAVCEGFSNLFWALGRAMGLKIEKVIGYTKGGYGSTAGKSSKKADHAWNAIKIFGNWRLFDATWGSGSGENVDGKLVSTKKFDDSWFNIDPYQAIFSHFPENEKFAFVKPALTLKGYERLPEIDNNYFDMGFDARETYDNILMDKEATFPQCFGFDTHLKMRIAPKFKTLFIGESYGFEFFIPRGLSAAIVDADNNWTYFRSDKGQFKVNYTPNTEGALQIAVNYKEGDAASYTVALAYEIKKK
jgi:Transglutaminase-like superfamily